MSKPSHIPVLVEEVVKLLDPKPDAILIDATTGLGGHTETLLTKLGPAGKIIGIDQDENALHLTSQKFSDDQTRVILVHGNFRDLGELVKNAGYQAVDGILLDLGFSSFQIDDPARGFSFLHNAPLDMRMNQGGGGPTAADILNRASFSELVTLLTEYGEEPKAESITKRILEFRKSRPIKTTFDLVEIVGGKAGKIHPATKTFQALRIAVNEELQALIEVLPQAIGLLSSGGRLAIISFHSLEDRIVKNFFKYQAEQGKVKLITKKTVAPSWQEVKRNPRARSAKLRVIEKI